MPFIESTKAMLPRTVGPKSGRLPASSESSADEFPPSVLDDNCIPDPPAPPAPVDAAHIAARALVLLAVDDPALLEALRRPGQIIVVEAPYADWLPVLSLAWREVVFQTQEKPDQPDSGRLRWRSEEATWTEFLRDGSVKGHRPDLGNDDLAEAIVAQRTVVGFSQAPGRFLPRDLTRAADHTIVIQPLDSSALSAVVESILDVDTDLSLPEEICRKIGPAELRLAYRAGCSADEFLKRLHALTVGPEVKRGTTLDQMAGMDEAVGWGNALAIDLAAYTKGELPWSDVDRGVLLVGPPGTGKTTFCKALAGTCQVPLIIGSPGLWQSAGHLGDTLAAMRASFDEAKRARPSILLIDEIDSVGNRDEFSHENKNYSIQVVNALLEQLDGAIDREGVIVVAATNDDRRLDPALVRSGRLDRTIRIGLPDQRALVAILRHHLGPEHLPDADLSVVARLCLGGTGADVERVVRGARRRARTDRRAMVIDDLLAEVRGDGTNVDPTVFRLACVHESGHAVAIAVLAPGSLQSVSVRSRDGVGGVTRSRDKPVPTVADIEAKLIALLAGRAAEKLVLGQLSAGAGGSADSDLALATQLALASAVSLGLSDGPPVWLGAAEAGTVDGLLHRYPAIAEQVYAMIGDAERRADEFVREHRHQIEVVAELLRRAETISGADVAFAISETARTPEVLDVPQ